MTDARRRQEADRERQGAGATRVDRLGGMSRIKVGLGGYCWAAAHLVGGWA